MTEVNFTAERVSSVYEVLVNLGRYTPSLKWDTGAKYTVISARALDKNLSDAALERMKSYCEENQKHKERFISASGDPIYGYLSHVKNVVMDETVLSDFHYPLVLENKRDIALLGFDFIDKCKREADAYGDIIITEFDDEGYSSADSALENDELISLIDSLSEELK